MKNTPETNPACRAAGRKQEPATDLAEEIVEKVKTALDQAEANQVTRLIAEANMYMSMEEILDEIGLNQEESTVFMRDFVAGFRSMQAGKPKEERRQIADDAMTRLYREPDDEMSGKGVYAALAALSRRRTAERGRELGYQIMEKRNVNYRKKEK